MSVSEIETVVAAADTGSFGSQPQGRWKSTSDISYMFILFNHFFFPQKSSLAGHGVLQLEQEDQSSRLAWAQEQV